MIGGLLSTLAFTSVVGLPTEDRVVAPDLDQWLVAYERNNATRTMREEVPEGESLEHWTRMVSTDRFGGLAARTTPENYIADVVRNVERWCPGTQVGPLKSLSMTGRPATRVTINCPQLSLTGKSVTFTMEVTTGTFDLLVNEVAFQGAPTPADAAWATQFLDNLIYCAGGTTVSACTREPPPRLTKPYHEKPLLPWP